jgi:uncharacterized protein with GYD domain
VPRYLLLLRSDAVGAARMLDGLTTGFDEFPAQVARYNGTVEALYALAGRYDAAVVVDFAAPEGMVAFSLAATAEGQYVEALPAFRREELLEAEALARDAASSFGKDLAEAIEAKRDRGDPRSG